MRRTISRGWIVPILLAVLLPVSAWAQSYNSTLNGTVTDPSGAVVPNVELTLTSVATGAVAKATTGPDGLFVFPNLQPGSYELKASAKGFREYLQRGISALANQVARVEVRLELGAETQTIEVLENASPLNYENAARKESITPEEVKALPLEVSGTVRSAANFAVLMPGVSTGSGGNAFDARINGGLQSGDEAILDGVSMQEGLMSQSGMVSIQSDFPMSPDMVREVTVLTSNYEPQYGSTTSGQIIIETKSGTNEYHGTLYEYHRNTALNARQFGVDERPTDLEHEFGGGLGGPLAIPHLWPKSRRTFFYINLEGYRSIGGITRNVLSIPTMQERQGDFRDWPFPIYDPDTLRANPNYDPNQDQGPNNLPFLRNQFMGCDGKTPNVICPTDPRMQNSLAQQWFQFLPPPNRPGVLNNYVVPKPRPEELLFHTNYLDVRVDQYFRDKDHVSLSVYYQGAHPNYFTSGLPRQLSSDNFTAPQYAFIDRLNWDHTFSPTLLNHTAVGYLNREEGYGSLDAIYADQLPQVPGVPSHAYPPVINLGDFAQFGDPYGANKQNVTARPSAVINDLLTWVKGKHTFKFGGEYRWLGENNRRNFAGANSEAGVFSFSSGQTGLRGIESGSPIASFLLGEVDNASVVYYSDVASIYPRASAWIWHVGDTWKATPKLSINYGLRWDFFTPSDEKWDQASFFDPYGANAGAGGRPGRLAFAGNKWGPASFGARHSERNWHKGYAPRLGIAYTVTPKTVVRAGYGIFYTQAFYPGWNGGVTQDGFSANPSFSSPDGGLSPAFLLRQDLVNQGVGFPQSFPRPPFVDPSYLNGQNIPNYRPFDANRLSYSQQWNLTIEHQFTNNFYISTAYVANKGTRLPSRISPLNALDPKLLSLGPQLYDVFSSGDTILDGVPAPYRGWADQMTACAPTVAQALLPYPQYCGAIYGLNENAGNSTYHSFQVKAEKRFERGIWLLTSYTLSKTLDDADQTQADSLTWSGAHGVISKFEQHRNKALAVDDVPQTLSVAFIYELPFGAGKRWANSSGVLNRIFGGWSLSGTFRASSGVPFFFRSSGNCNVPSQFVLGCIPAQLPGANPFTVSKGSYDPHWSDVDADGNPTPQPLFNINGFESKDLFNGFYYGKGPRISNLRQFGYHNQDLGLIKDTRITEKVGLQLRAEFFNIWNWHIFNCPTQCWGGSAFDTDVASPTFGQWNGSVTAPRNIQVAVRVSF